MFKVSTKGDYGLLLMTVLAEHFLSGNAENNVVSLKMIAERKNLSLSYISQLILPLKNAGLVLSKEGLGGGYRLAKHPSEISLLEILEALEGPIAPVRCCNEKADKCQCESVCNAKYAWHDAISLLRHHLESRKLLDIIQKKPDQSIIFS